MTGHSSEDATPDLELVQPQPDPAQQLPPFTTPAGFDHGPEFEPPSPRPIPGWLRKGSFGRRRWGVVLTLIMLGVGCIAFAPLPIVERMAFHVLPLAYLNYIGVGLLAIAAIVWLRQRFSMERLNYVRDGIPIVGRVLAIDVPIQQTVNPETKQLIERFCYAVKVDYEHPQTLQREEAVLTSEEQWEKSKLSEYDPGVEPGDYVTLVALPGQISESLKLYGFLGLDPERDFITRKGRALAGLSPYTAVIITMAVFIGLWLLITGLYVVLACMPQEFAWKPGVIFLGVGMLLGSLGLRALVRLDQTKSQMPHKGGFGALLIGTIPGLIFGGITMGLVNAFFDRSPATYRPVHIDNYWQTTHNFLFRTYEVEYTPLGAPKSEKHDAGMRDLAKLTEAEHGALEVHEGALGMKWISGIHPFRWAPLPAELSPAERQIAVTFEAPLGGEGAPVTLNMAPVLVIDETTTVPAPRELVAVEAARLRAILEAPPPRE